MRDIASGDDPQINAIAAIIDKTAPDVLVLTNFDYDLDGFALAAFARTLRSDYPYQFADQPNTGVPSGFDLDGNGRLGEARDAWGYGRFPGQGGLAILSRLPILTDDVRDLSAMLWRDVPGAPMPQAAEAPFYNAQVAASFPASTTAHWIVPIAPENGTRFDILAYSATPPVFDGQEDANGLRNSAELAIWSAVLAGELGPVPTDPVLVGNTNLDPEDGDGLRPQMAAFLNHPQLQDPRPASLGGAAAADSGQNGDPALDTADWPDGAPGNLRVSYVLPAAAWRVANAGVFWPKAGDPDAALLGEDGLAAGPHRLVWVDISR